MQERDSHDSSAWRDPALDLARGFAVLAMVWVHFVPEPGQGDAGALAVLQWASVAWLDGFPAALFLVLVGASAVVAGAGRRSHVWRRSIALAVVGLLFWVFVWPNDILLPIALMLPVVALLQRLGRTAITAVVVVLLVLVPIATCYWGHYAWSDVRDDGTHLANHGVGWFTARYFLIDGAYPLLPWLVMPLFGMLMARARHDVLALRVIVGLAMACVVVALVASQLWGDEYAGGVAAHLDVTWQPTSLPFVMLWGGAAAVFLAAIMLWLPRGAKLSRCAAIAAVGRASLTHYLMHLVVVYATMRLWWPDEDWSSAVGAAVAVGYMLLALFVTPRWLAARRRGPLEELLARCSGGR